MSPLINRRNLFKLGLTSGLAGAISAWWPRRASAQRHVPFVDLAITPSGDGLWALHLLGRVFTYGGAPKFSDPPDPDRELYVALAAAPSGNGLYALTADGSVRTFGDAMFDVRAGGGRRIPFVDLAITPSGDGLWALDPLGRVFTFGGAPKFATPPEPIRERYVELAAARSRSNRRHVGLVAVHGGRRSVTTRAHFWGMVPPASSL